jgi:hypothetical protein
MAALPALLRTSVVLAAALASAAACSDVPPEGAGPAAATPGDDGGGAAGVVDGEDGGPNASSSSSSGPPPVVCPEVCVSIADLEGRCLSVDETSVAALDDVLPQGACPEQHRCVPCYEPFGGEPTGACPLACDPGPGPPVTFDACCDGIGACIPSDLVPDDQVEALGEDVCASGNLCAPVALIDGTFVAEACETSKLADKLGDEYLAGACMPACLAALDHPILQQDGCPDGFKCAPCKAPPDGEDTGICDLIR